MSCFTKSLSDDLFAIISQLDNKVGKLIVSLEGSMDPKQGLRESEKTSKEAIQEE